MAANARQPLRTTLDSMPDLCTPGSVLLLVVVGSLAALVYTLISTESASSFWLDFGLALLFIQWVVLSSTVLCCVARRYFPNSRFTGAVWLLFFIVPLVTLLATVASVRISPVDSGDQLGWLFTRNLLISVLVSLTFVRYLALQQRWKQQVAAQASARMDALQARIHPHFLFNALNTITELVHSRPIQAEEALLDLSDLLRSGLRVDTEHALQEELELIRSYLRIESLRLGERLEVSWSIDERIDLSQVRPALLIQPLVENAVLHGIAPSAEGGRLAIKLDMIRFGRIRVTIENPVPTDPSNRLSGNGTALDNIRQRLELAYEEGAQLKTDQVGQVFRAILTLPPGRTRAS